MAGCVVVPLDPKTGHPVYPPSTATTVVVQPAPGATSAPIAHSWTVRLYPLNAEASKSGVLLAQVMDRLDGRGSFSLNYRGETLQGESTRVAGQRGLANAAAPSGLSAQCEYQITGARIGTGSCQFSDGARWQMHFGG